MSAQEESPGFSRGEDVKGYEVTRAERGAWVGDDYDDDAPGPDRFGLLDDAVSAYNAHR